jgi:CysZ protein
MKDLLTGFFLPFQGLKMLWQPGIRRYALLPLLLNIIVFAALAWLAGGYFEVFMDEYLPENTWWDFIRPLLWLVFAAAYMVTVFYTFTLVANLIAAPFNSLLAVKIEQQLSGKAAQESNRSLLASIGPAILNEAGKLLYLLKMGLPLLALFLISAFIPGLNVIVSLLWIGFGFWFLSIEYADYPMGNHDIPAKQQRKILAAKRFKSLSFGAGISTMMLIPILWFAAMPAAVAAATRYWVDDLNQN